MASQEETTFQEALAAIQKGEKDRARDLLTRLIKLNPAQSQYWLWMSAVVESPKERIFCLKETLKRDPKNRTARRGLIVHGELALDLSLAVPPHLQQRNWEAGLFNELGELPKPKTPLGIPLWAILGTAAVIILAVAVITATLNRAEIPPFLAWIQRYTPAPTSANAPVALLSTPTPTLLVLRTSTAPPTGLLTATPTALYVNTPHPRTESYRAAVASYQKGDLAAAASYLLQVVKEDPKPDIYYMLGEVYRQQGKARDAAQAYDLAIQQDPKFAPAYLGRAYLRQATAPDQAQAARADLEKAISLDANLVEAYLELARFKIANKEAAAALSDLDNAQQKAPDSPLPYFYRAQAYLYLNQVGKAVLEARQASRMDPAMLPAYRLWAEAERADGNYAGSIQPLETYTQYTKDDEAAMAWLGQAYAARGDTANAQRLLDQAINLNGQSLEARLLRGTFYLEQGNSAKAQEDFRQAYSIRPDAFGASLGFGRIALLNKDSSEASRYFSLALFQAKTDVEKAQAYFWRAQALELAKQLSQAIADWSELLRFGSGSLIAPLKATALARVPQLNQTTTPATSVPSSSPTASSTQRPTTATTPTPTVRPSPTTPPG